MSRRLRSRRGAAAIELAMVLPLLIAVIGGIVTLSWVLLSYASLVDAVSEGARRASVVVRQPGDPRPFGDGIRDVAEVEIKAAAERVGWKPTDVVVAVGFGDRDGVSHMTVQGTAPLSSRWSGLIFSVPYALRYETTLATLDQP
ncbi:MAG: TadE/TadG family type IV pilus assembly protein [Myxococcota bacterium]